MVIIKRKDSTRYPMRLPVYILYTSNASGIMQPTAESSGGDGFVLHKHACEACIQRGEFSYTNAQNKKVNIYSDLRCLASYKRIL